MQYLTELISELMHVLNEHGDMKVVSRCKVRDDRYGITFQSIDVESTLITENNISLLNEGGEHGERILII